SDVNVALDAVLSLSAHICAPYVSRSVFFRTDVQIRSCEKERKLRRQVRPPRPVALALSSQNPATDSRAEMLAVTSPFAAPRRLAGCSRVDPRRFPRSGPSRRAASTPSPSAGTRVPRRALVHRRGGGGVVGELSLRRSVSASDHRVPGCTVRRLAYSAPGARE